MVHVIYQFGPKQLDSTYQISVHSAHKYFKHKFSRHVSFVADSATSAYSYFLRNSQMKACKRVPQILMGSANLCGFR